MLTRILSAIAAAIIIGALSCNLLPALTRPDAESLRGYTAVVDTLPLGNWSEVDCDLQISQKGGWIISGDAITAHQPGPSSTQILPPTGSTLFMNNGKIGTKTVISGVDIFASFYDYRIVDTLGQTYLLYRLSDKSTLDPPSLDEFCRSADANSLRTPVFALVRTPDYCHDGMHPIIIEATIDPRLSGVWRRCDDVTFAYTATPSDCGIAPACWIFEPTRMLNCDMVLPSPALKTTLFACNGKIGQKGDGITIYNFNYTFRELSGTTFLLISPSGYGDAIYRPVHFRDGIILRR